MSAVERFHTVVIRRRPQSTVAPHGHRHRSAACPRHPPHHRHRPRSSTLRVKTLLACAFFHPRPRATPLPPRSAGGVATRLALSLVRAALSSPIRWSTDVELPPTAVLAMDSQAGSPLRGHQRAVLGVINASRARRLSQPAGALGQQLGVPCSRSPPSSAELVVEVDYVRRRSWARRRPRRKLTPLPVRSENGF